MAAKSGIVVPEIRISNLKIMISLLCLGLAWYDVAKKIIKETEKEWKKVEQGEMKEEDHQLELKENYEQDETYEESNE